MISLAFNAALFCSLVFNLGCAFGQGGCGPVTVLLYYLKIASTVFSVLFSMLLIRYSEGANFLVILLVSKIHVLFCMCIVYIASDWRKDFYKNINNNNNNKNRKHDEWTSHRRKTMKCWKKIIYMMKYKCIMCKLSSVYLLIINLWNSWSACGSVFLTVLTISYDSSIRERQISELIRNLYPFGRIYCQWF